MNILRRGILAVPHLFLVLSIPCFSAGEQDCVFQGRVHPENHYKEVSKLYRESCEWFVETFDVTFDPEIVLNNVYYILDWSEVPFVQPYDELYGIFNKVEDKSVNDIYFRMADQGAYIRSHIINRSIVVHEMVHFFIKKAHFEQNMENGAYENVPMFEAFVYWAQDRYIKSVTNGQLGLLDYMKEEAGKAFPLLDPFPRVSYRLYMGHNLKMFVHNAIQWFEKDPKGRYQQLINGDFPLGTRMY